MYKFHFFLLVLSASLLYPRTRIGITIDSDVEFDLHQVLYPPLVFPAYYFPTQASSFNPHGITLTVSFQRIGPQHDISEMYLATRGSGDFSSTVALDQLHFAPQGEPLPPAGVDPPGGNWRAYSIFYQNIEQFEVGGAGLQRFDRPQDYIFKAEVDDESGDQSVILYYRVFGL
jgi:hypothetical protein